MRGRSTKASLRWCSRCLPINATRSRIRSTSASRCSTRTGTATSRARISNGCSRCSSNGENLEAKGE
eukprot:3226782-Prymnesium_polylepis.1